MLVKVIWFRNFNCDALWRSSWLKWKNVLHVSSRLESLELGLVDNNRFRYTLDPVILSFMSHQTMPRSLYLELILNQGASLTVAVVKIFGIGTVQIDSSCYHRQRCSCNPVFRPLVSLARSLSNFLLFSTNRAFEFLFFSRLSLSVAIQNIFENLHFMKNWIKFTFHFEKEKLIPTTFGKID